MAVNMTNAIAAYGNAGGGVFSSATAERSLPDTSPPGAPGGIEADPATDFSDMLRSSLEASRETIARSEDMSAKAVHGDAALHDVVTAVSAAEVTLQTVVTMRDRVTQAYQEILRMPI